MSNTWTAFNFKNLLVTQVNTAIAGGSYDPVPKVVSYFPSPDEDNTDSVAIGWQMTDENEAVVLGNQRFDESVTVQCRVNVTRPGAGEETAQAAETRAALLMGEVDDQVRTNPPSVGDQTLRATVTNRNSVSMAWFVGDGVPARRCVVEFDVVYRARTSNN